MNRIITFKRERDLGAIITDAFGFIRSEWKPLLMCILKITWPFVAISLFAIALYFYTFSNVLDNFSTANLESNPFAMFSGSNFLSIILMMFAALATYTLMQIVATLYIKSYIENDGQVIYDDIVKQTRNQFWSILGFVILSLILIVLGTILCIIPGIYLYVPFSLGITIMVFEEKNIGETISHCFILVKDHWFETFGVLLVVSILVGILGYVFNIPSLIYSIVKMATSIGKEDPTAFIGFFSDPIYLLLTVFSYAGRFLMTVITVIAIVLIYFDLNEQKFQSGTIETIENLGKN